MQKLSPPTPTEYAPFYADYIQRAQALGDVVSALPKQIENLKNLLANLSETQALYKPAPSEWSIKEVIGHLNDVERVFSYRLLRVSRGDKTPLPGFEQDEYVRQAGFDAYPLADLLSEFENLRSANIAAIRNMKAEAADFTGAASGAPVSARALIYMLAGHVEHHMASLLEKYIK